MNTTQLKDLCLDNDIEPDTIDWQSMPKDIDPIDWVKNEYGYVLRTKHEMVNYTNGLIEQEEIRKEDKKHCKPNSDPFLKQVFFDCRVVGMAGSKDSGKTNNLAYLIYNLRKDNTQISIYAFGFPLQTMEFLRDFGVIEISSLKHLINKRNCVIILDEIQRLKLNDRRYKYMLDEFVSFIYHNNNYVIFCSPNIREFNSIIGSVIEKWLLKSIDIDMCVNGSQLKKVIDTYTGQYKVLGSIQIPKNKVLVINDDKDIVIDCEYIEIADSKKNVRKLF